MSEVNTGSAAEEASKAPPTLLFVDDEANILGALKRLFRPHGYRVFIAESGAAGLEIMERETVDLVISDMRMPEMNGAQFLEKVRAKWPDVVRILLTGYAEIGATIDAINKGEIYRYISKPWEDNDVVLTVKQALERKFLEGEKNRLERLTLRQNEELRSLNASLEDKVKARTEEVRQTMGFLQIANEKLKKSFLTSIRVLSSLVEMREGTGAGHSRRVADLARKISQRLAVPDADAQDIFIAGLLHDMGKMGLPDRLLNRPFSVLSPEERAEVMKHPAKGQAVLMELEQLQTAAALIRCHHERFDGQGYPDGIGGMQIPLGARILAVANDYDAVQTASVMSRPMSAAEAVAYIKEGRGSRYDPQVVDAFLAVLGAMEKMSAEEPGVPLRSSQLKPGMVLARDLLTPDGILLLSKGYTLSDGIISQLHSYENAEKKHLTVHVKG